MSDATSKVTAFLTARFEHSELLRLIYQDLWSVFSAAGLADDHFVQEFTCGDRGKFYQRAWEMRLARHLLTVGHRVTTCARGPDFCFEYEGKRVWVEATSPGSGASLEDWLKPPPPNGIGLCKEVPFKAILLRYTSAFAEKRRKLDVYLRDGVVQAEDAYVIAIDGSHLALTPLDHGASQLPFIVETVFAAGPLGFLFGDDGRLVDIAIGTQQAVFNRNNASVGTAAFLQHENRAVSAVVACSPGDSDNELLQLYAAYNPFAAIPIEGSSVFGKTAEHWRAVELQSEAGTFDLVRS